MKDLGIKKINGIVIKRNRNTMYILRDDRIDGGCDLLIGSGAAANLSEGERFSLYVTAISVKEVKGIKIYTFADSTLKRDIHKTHTLKFSTQEMMLLLFIIKEHLNFISIQKLNSKIKDYSVEKQFADLKKIQQKLQTIIK